MRFLKKIFSEQKPLKVDLENADVVFEEQRNEEIKNAESEAENFRNNAENKIEGLKKVLEDIEDFQDEKGRKAVDDIAENLVRDRKEVINNISLTGDPKENLEALKEFMVDFQDLKRKEAAVLEITSKEKEIGRYMKEMQELIEEFDNFLDDEYVNVERHAEIEQKLEERNEIGEEIKSYERKKQGLEIEELEDKISDKKREIEGFKAGERINEYKELENQLQDLRDERKQILSEINSAASQMERGLKKLIYQAENSDLELEGLNLLRNIRDQETEALLENPVKVEKALPQLKEKGDISDVQRKKLNSGMEKLGGLSDKKSRIEALKDKISSLEEEIENHSAPDKLEELQRDLERFKQELEEEKSREKELESEIRDLKDKSEELESEIKEVFRSSFDREVIFES
jgi:chromosome segregation ATPase